jgi:hypothetical protein
MSQRPVTFEVCEGAKLSVSEGPNGSIGPIAEQKRGAHASAFASKGVSGVPVLAVAPADLCRAAQQLGSTAPCLERATAARATTVCEVSVATTACDGANAGVPLCSALFLMA